MKIEDLKQQKWFKKFCVIFLIEIIILIALVCGIFNSLPNKKDEPIENNTSINDKTSEAINNESAINEESTINANVSSNTNVADSGNRGDTVIVENEYCKHEYESKTLVKPTCTTDGLMELTCKKCGFVLRTPIKKLGHSYVNGTCTRCGLRDPNYKIALKIDNRLPTTCTIIKDDEVLCIVKISDYDYDVNTIVNGRYSLSVDFKCQVTYLSENSTALSYNVPVTLKDSYGNMVASENIRITPPSLCMVAPKSFSVKFLNVKDSKCSLVISEESVDPIYY